MPRTDFRHGGRFHIDRGVRFTQPPFVGRFGHKMIDSKDLR